MPLSVYVPSRVGEGYFTDWQAPASGATDTGKVWAWNDATGSYEPTTLPTVITDHGGLSGLADDDHAQYLLATGSRTGASSSLQAFTSGVVTGIVRPASDSTTAFRVQNAAGSSDVLTVDTTNGRISVIGTAGNQLSVKDFTSNNTALLSISAGQVSFLTTANIPFAFATSNIINLILRSGASQNVVSVRGTTSQTGQYFRVETSAQAEVFSVKPVSSSDQTALVSFGVGTATAICDLRASTTAYASLRIRSGAAPTSPNDGDIWFNGTNFQCRVGGVTYNLDMTAA